MDEVRGDCQQPRELRRDEDTGKNSNRPILFSGRTKAAEFLDSLKIGEGIS